MFEALPYAEQQLYSEEFNFVDPDEYSSAVFPDLEQHLVYVDGSYAEFIRYFHRRLATFLQHAIIQKYGRSF